MTPPARAASKPLAVSAIGLEKAYGQRPAIRGMNLTISIGERVALFGDNGAGKSTLLQLISGLLRPSGGSVHIFGAQPWGREGARTRAQIGTLSHQSHLYEELSAHENLTLYGRLYGVNEASARADALITEFGLAGRRTDPIRTLSRGMTQRVSLMRSLIHVPSMLLLDEPETGLDAASREILAARITQPGADVTVILATHNIEMGVALTTRDLVLRGGEIIHDSAAAAVSAEDDAQRRELVSNRLGQRTQGNH